MYSVVFLLNNFHGDSMAAIDLKLKCAFDWKVPITDVTILSAELKENSTIVTFQVKGKATEDMRFPDAIFIHKTEQ